MSYNKYLKYKLKYLTLKNQLGGSCPKCGKELGAAEVCHCDQAEEKFVANPNCNCQKCQKVKENLSRGIWLHNGTGKMSKNKFNKKPIGTVLEDFFIQPLDRIESNHGKRTLNMGRNPKPNCLWFSAGSWLFDPFHDKTNHGNLNKNFKRTIMISEPKKILRIKTKEELESFIDTYSGYKISDKTIQKQKNLNNAEEMGRFYGKEDRFLHKVELVKKFFAEHKLDFKLIEKFIADNYTTYFYLTYKDSKNYISFIKALTKAYPEFLSLNLDQQVIDKLKVIDEYDFETGQEEGATLAEIIINIKLKDIYHLIYFNILKSIPDETQRNIGKIDWDAIYNLGEGYYGVSFEFCKVYELGISEKDYFTNPRYQWHSRFDVESLCIFDVRAFENKVTIVENHF